MADEASQEPSQTAEKTAPEGEPAAAAGDAAKGKKKKLLILVSAAVGLVGLAVAGGVVFMMKSKGGHTDDVGVPGTVFYDVPQFAVNLGEGGDEGQFLKLKIAMELRNEDDRAKVQLLMPRLQDDYQAFLRQLRVDDLRGSAALARLKEALLLRANQALAPVRVQNVLFQEVLVQ